MEGMEPMINRHPMHLKLTDWAYWVTAKMRDGNEARIVLWVADTAISRKRVEDGTMYFVADAVTGAPIDRADLEFFGWRQEYQQRQQARPPTPR
jgi:hypothetical protein